MVDYHSILHLRKERAEKARRRVAIAAENLRLRSEEYRKIQVQRANFLKEIQTLETELMNALLERPVTINDVLNVDEIMQVATHRAQNLAERLNEAKLIVEDATTRHKQYKNVMRQREIECQKSLELSLHISAAERLRRLRQDEEIMEEYAGFGVAKDALHE